uniref:YegP family protein n=1 Tax=Streptomyces turgidiscabies TaxID=85558 RepID=UPI0038F7E699
MSGKFELKKAKDGQFHFNLLATNGQVILSSEMYKAKDSALNGIESVKKNSQREGAFESTTSSNDKH